MQSELKKKKNNQKTEWKDTKIVQKAKKNEKLFFQNTTVSTLEHIFYFCTRAKNDLFIKRGSIIVNRMQMLEFIWIKLIVRIS